MVFGSLFAEHLGVAVESHELHCAIHHLPRKPDSDERHSLGLVPLRSSPPSPLADLSWPTPFDSEIYGLFHEDLRTFMPLGIGSGFHRDIGVAIFDRFRVQRAPQRDEH